MDSKDARSFSCDHGHTLSTAIGLAEAYTAKCFDPTQLNALVAELTNSELVAAIRYLAPGDLDPDYMRENDFEPDKLSRDGLLIRLAVEGVITQEAILSGTHVDIRR